jgi:hypothetical protein
MSNIFELNKYFNYYISLLKIILNIKEKKIFCL